MFWCSALLYYNSLSLGFGNIDDRHRKPNSNIREIIWLGDYNYCETNSDSLPWSRQSKWQKFSLFGKWLKSRYNHCSTMHCIAMHCIQIQNLAWKKMAESDNVAIQYKDGKFIRFSSGHPQMEGVVGEWGLLLNVASWRLVGIQLFGQLPRFLRLPPDLDEILLSAVPSCSKQKFPRQEPKPGGEEWPPLIQESQLEHGIGLPGIEDLHLDRTKILHPVSGLGRSSGLLEDGPRGS